MYDNILIPIAPGQLEQSEPSIHVACCLLRPGGKITVMTVLEQLPTYVAEHLPEDRMDHDRARMTATLDAHFQGQHNIATRTDVGLAAPAILAAALEDDHDCIILASDKPGFADILLGSTATKVVKHARCGVHILR